MKLCSALPIDASTVSPFSTEAPNQDKSSDSRNAAPVTQLEPQKSSAGFVSAVCSVFAIIFVAVCWVFYAYTHPHTSSGQFLIQYGRPAAWSWRRGEARYTAATIHMWSASNCSLPLFSSNHFFIVLYLLSFQSGSIYLIMWWRNLTCARTLKLLKLFFYLLLSRLILMLLSPFCARSRLLKEIEDMIPFSKLKILRIPQRIKIDLQTFQLSYWMKIMADISHLV